ncbi:unnamed protein product [Darwinula stevensoni]|uniref:Uncharacterized protein n=1 Tax=Darwinula stevensoni TaxID=69355 RepID=A0A7R9AIQ8_9CRUS|nr:unnamed protein product [Darwinula stevensoni]CAG0906879.1 unnamed protein product [Darwinula stevensoni]
MRLRHFVIPSSAVIFGLLSMSYVQARSISWKEDMLDQCYHNRTIRDRFRRIPTTMDSLIGLIKKVEQHPTGKYWDVHTMAANLLRRFRIDGLQFLPENLGGRIIPESVEKMKLDLLWKISNIGRAEEFPEDSLTLEEKVKCNH